MFARSVIFIITGMSLATLKPSPKVATSEGHRPDDNDLLGRHSLTMVVPPRVISTMMTASRTTARAPTAIHVTKKVFGDRFLIFRILPHDADALDR